jgi:ribosome-associated translation inhibitor RaiA
MDMTRHPFTDRSSKRDKTARGRTAAAHTPVSIRTGRGVTVSPQLREHVLSRLGRGLGPQALRIERATVRFEDVNGPRGGVDSVCRMKVVVSGLPSVVTEQRAASPREAFDLTAGVAQRAVRRHVARSAPRRRRASARTR